MSELPITKNEKDRSVWLVLFIREVKEFAKSNPKISDLIFTPVIKGYEIEYLNNGVSERLSVNAKSRFFKGLVIKKYADGKFKGIFRLKEKQISKKAINRIVE